MCPDGVSATLVAMGLNFRRRISVGKNTNVNLSRSGAGVSRKIGPVTINSRGRTTIRLGKGFNFKL